jgi:hypothetical protein
MVATITHYDCPPGTWTEVSDGFANVQIRLQGPSQMAHIGMGSAAPTEPPAPDSDTILIYTGEPESFSFAGTDTKVYVQPDPSVERTVTVKVVKE